MNIRNSQLRITAQFLSSFDTTCPDCDRDDPFADPDFCINVSRESVAEIFVEQFENPVFFACETNHLTPQ